MATLTRGILSFNLDWEFIMIGVFIAITMELCGVKALAFAIGLYLPLATTLPIFVGGALKGFVDWRAERRKEVLQDSDLSRGNLFSTGLIAGGAITGVVAAVLGVFYVDQLRTLSMELTLVNLLGHGGYHILGTLFFIGMLMMLYRLAVKKD
jgi:uncharacterized oligopeptide transporter (OPT) family protein